MKYFICWAIFLLLAIPDAHADYLEDVKNLGYISGEGLACNAQKYKAYEYLSRAYLVSSAKSDAEQEAGMYEYNNAKARAFLRKRREGYYDCARVNQKFSNQLIFKAKLYKDGTLKMHDGKIIKPRQKYDVSKLYDKDGNEREKLNAYCDKLIAAQKKRAQKSGIYQKIRQAEAKSGY